MCVWSCPGKHVNSPVDLWLQVWHQPREHHPVWTEHRDSSHRRPGITLRVCGRGSALSTNFRHESGLSRHQENVLLRCFPQVSLQVCPTFNQWPVYHFNIFVYSVHQWVFPHTLNPPAASREGLSLIPVLLWISKLDFQTFKAVLLQIETHLWGLCHPLKGLDFS